MGKNCRFRISDMMPNAWFYKLKDMGRRGSKNQYTGRSQHQTPRSPATTPKLLPGRGSFYCSSRAAEAPAELSAFSPSHHHRRRASDALYPVEPPRKSKKSGRRKPAAAGTPAKPRPVVPPLSAACRESVGEFPSPDTPPRRRDYYVEYEHFASWSRSCDCGRADSSAAAADTSTSTTSSASKHEKLDAAELNLRPILTKPPAKEHEFEDKGVAAKERMKSQAKRSTAGLRRLRIRASSPRIPGKKAQGRQGRRSASSPSAAEEARGGVAASFAVVKASSDPQRDFRESMMEMIRENDITAAKDLEELLACYLSLNANEYHDVIVKVFEQIWFDLNFSCIKLVDY